MKHKKEFLKKLFTFAVAGLAIQVFPGNPAAGSSIYAQETFTDIIALYDYWCEDGYAHYPDNVGDVFMYYYEDTMTEASSSAHDSYDPYGPSENVSSEEFPTKVEEALPAEVEEALPAVYNYNYADMITSHAVETVENSSVSTWVGEDKAEPMEEKAADSESWTFVVGLLNDTPEEEQKILSLLEDQRHVAFTSCNYSYKELRAVQEEIDQFLTEKNLLNWGTGVTGYDSVMLGADGKFTPMKNHVTVDISYEYYEEISNILLEKYGDKVEITSMDMFIAEDAAIEEERGLGADLDIGGNELMTTGITTPASSMLSETENAMLIGKTYTWKNNAKEKVTWKVTPSKKVKILKKSSTLKFKAKKTGWVTVTAKTKDGKETKKILILNKNGVVSNQKQLMAALNSSQIKSITIKTAKKRAFTIPEGDYGKKKVIVNAKNSDILIENTVLSLDNNLIIKKGNVIMPDTDSQADGDTDTNVNIDIDTNANIDIPADQAPLSDDMSNVNYSFTGTIQEMSENKLTAVVKVDEGEPILSSSDLVSVGLGINTTDNFSVGDHIRVYYDGTVMETSPAQVNEFKIEKIS